MAADVLVGYLHGQQVDGAFHDALVGLLVADRFRRIAGVASIESGPLLAPARNQLAQTLMSSGARWLLSLDTDMVFPPDLVQRLLRHATGSRMVGALCFVYAKNGDMYPTMFDDTMTEISDWEPGALVPVRATGAACLLIPRTVFQRTPYPWYRTTDEHGEDQVFCDNARAAGFEVAVDTSTVVGHAKRVVITDAHYRIAQKSQKTTVL